MTRKKPEDVVLKAELAAAVATILKEREISRLGAAKLLGLSETAVVELVRGQLGELSEGTLVDCLLRLGQDVHIVINEKPFSRASARLSVLVIRPFKRPGPGAREPARSPGPKPWNLMTGSERKAYVAQMRARAKEAPAPPMSKEDAERVVLELTPTDHAH